MRTTIGTACMVWVLVGPGMARAGGTIDEPAKVAQALLASEEGTWDADVTMTLPGMDPAKSKATETNRLIGGKWLISDFQGEFGGQKFQGHGQTGFDAKKGKFVGTWVDSMSARIDTLEGTYDEASKTLTLYSDLLNPETGKIMKTKFVSVYKDGDTRVFTEFTQPDGSTEYVKMMEITYKRRAK